ncbi:MAG: hypothetical protein U5O16_14030 [Rhodococcus sp. (in: high G+C Gram-positive bacteria)]|uniref:hypothetical protein n=1 Tax=Rhodococcus sp. TaxID=1831 RepID=UPI002ADC45FA|nr:hypothetical protein [Rhodococcus sp. (in: high G+C Gram-positive bacteria)]
MSVDACVDGSVGVVAVLGNREAIERAVSVVDGAVFPPVDGSFVWVDTGSEWFRGWVAVDRAQVTAFPEISAVVTVVGVSADRGVWAGRVTPEQVIVEEPGAVALPGWWERIAPLLVETMAARRAAGAAEENKAELVAAHVQWRDALVESAHTWADENSLCSQFDNFMESHDLPGRSRMYDVEVEVNISRRVTVSVSASNCDDAADAVDTREVESALRDEYGIPSHVDLDLNCGDWSTENVEEA